MSKTGQGGGGDGAETTTRVVPRAVKWVPIGTRGGRSSY
jgi:hypothetical protein